MKEGRKGFIKGLILGIFICLLVGGAVKGFNLFLIPARVDGFSRTDWNDFMAKSNDIKAILDTYYFEDIDSEKMKQGMYYGQVSSIGDPYTTYMDKERFESYMEDTEGSFAGIGVYVTMDPKDGLLTVTQVFPGSPSEEADLRPGDKVVAVDGESMVGMDDKEVIKRIKGPENTKVQLSIYREDEDEPLEKELTRRKIEVPTVETKMLENNIGYMKVLGFDAVTDEQFLKELVALEKNSLNGLIIDLRNNGGGYLDVALNMTDLFVPEGIITYTIDGKGNRKDYKTADNVYFNKPLVVLVNEYSASASEIFTGAVKDYGVGTIVGNTTFGKGLVQKPYLLRDGSAVKVTVSRYYTPNGNYINKTGIEPDVSVELPKEFRRKASVPEESDTQLEAALDTINQQMNQ